MTEEEKANQHIKNVIKHAKIKFFRRDFELAVFGIMSYKYEWIVGDYDNEGFVALSFDDAKPIDGYIHISRKFVGQPDYTSDDLIGLIIHELSHIFRRHGILGKNKSNKELYNLACDHVIDRSCRDLKIVHFYKDQFNIIPQLDREMPNCVEEEAYQWLLKHSKQFPQSGKTANSTTITDDNTGQEFEVNDISNTDDQATVEGKQKLKEKIEQIINNARATNNILEQKGRGTSSNGSIKEFLSNLLKVEIKWETLVEKAIKTNTILKPNDRSWRAINKYYAPHGITLPGVSMEEEKENVGILVIWIDISGSISKKDLKKFAYIINQSLDNFDKTHVLVHNSGIVQNVQFESSNKIEFITFINTIGFDVGGGTAHEDCYRFVQKEYWDGDNELKDKLSLILSLTDGYSDIDSCLSDKKFTWCKSVPTVFISTTGQSFGDEIMNTSTIFIK